MTEDRTGIGQLIKEKIVRFRRIFVHKLDAKEIKAGTLTAGETTLTDGSSLNLQEAITFTGATQENIVAVPDNLGAALILKEGATAYLTLNTTNGSEQILLGKNVTIVGNIALTGTVDGVDIAGWIDQDVSSGSSPTFGTVSLDSTPGDDAVSGTTMEFTAGENLAWGDFCYIDANGEMKKCDADAIATSYCVAFCTETVNEDASGTFLLRGVIRDDDGWGGAMTPGGPVFLSVTAGDTSQTAPSGADDCVAIVGVALAARVLFFNPSPQAVVEHTG